MYVTYILYSDVIHRYYTGQTEDLHRRIEEHNRGKTPGMEKGLPWKIVYTMDFRTRSEAMQLERYIKKRGASRFLDDIKKGDSG